LNQAQNHPQNQQTLRSFGFVLLRSPWWQGFGAETWPPDVKKP